MAAYMLDHQSTSLGVEETGVEREHADGVRPARPAHLRIVKHVIVSCKVCMDHRVPRHFRSATAPGQGTL